MGNDRFQLFVDTKKVPHFTTNNITGLLTIHIITCKPTDGLWLKMHTVHHMEHRQREIQVNIQINHETVLQSLQTLQTKQQLSYLKNADAQRGIVPPPAAPF